ncbi:hypothetical protein RJ640_022753 [Escallonia rubra]|uniref:RNA polymerase II subunit 5-mediating protein n=1 Tax=Escallonia rubra TaxID=112253 RepID=A0AA88SJN3_9ASTE|nr:hypothetical protein RJ640_022753 [Escallonia rubra]
MERPVKGTVTSLSSVYPAEEAQRASARVHDTIAERRKELDQLKGFAAENNGLVNLVQKLPEELHHDIMARPHPNTRNCIFCFLFVPFGKAAFFPGRLIHTNEFLVLLGEGYFAERTSKQTVEILKRRGKTLESQVESLKAVMDDLKAEASFFDATAAEAAVMAPKQESPSFSATEKTKAAVEDEEYARIWSRIDELEKEELEAEDDTEHSEDELNEPGLDHKSKLPHANEVKSSEVNLFNTPLEQSKAESPTREKSLKPHFQQDSSDQLYFEGSKEQPESRDGSLHQQRPAFSEPNNTERRVKFSDLEGDVQLPPTSKKEAFTGSIVEHAHKLEVNPREQNADSARTSKPVSRFKMHRRVESPQTVREENCKVEIGILTKSREEYWKAEICFEPKAVVIFQLLVAGKEGYSRSTSSLSAADAESNHLLNSTSLMPMKLARRINWFFFLISDEAFFWPPLSFLFLLPITESLGCLRASFWGIFGSFFP